MKIIFMAAKPYSVKMFLKSRMKYAIKSGYEVGVITGFDFELKELCEELCVNYYVIEIERRFSPFKDLKSLMQIVQMLSRLDVDILHTISSKAGLLGAISSFVLRIPYRFHIYAGLPWMEMKGMKKLIGVYSDTLISHLMTMTYADSKSEMEHLIYTGICRKNKIKVIGQGSVSGFDIERFNDSSLDDESLETRKCYGLQNRRIILYLGRIAHDKGMTELINGFREISKKLEFSDVVLVVAGPVDEVDVPSKSVLRTIESHENIVPVGYQKKPELWYAISEFLVLPSYREGFGNVVIEAALAGIPTVGTNIVGLRDSIVDNYTGVLVDKKNTEQLIAAMELMLRDQGLREKLGRQAKTRAEKEFSEERVNALILEEYGSVCLNVSK